MLDAQFKQQMLYELALLEDQQVGLVTRNEWLKGVLSYAV